MAERLGTTKRKLTALAGEVEAMRERERTTIATALAEHAAMFNRITALEAILAAHVADDTRHTGKVR